MLYSYYLCSPIPSMLPKHACALTPCLSSPHTTGAPHIPPGLPSPTCASLHHLCSFTHLCSIHSTYSPSVLPVLPALRLTGIGISHLYLWIPAKKQDWSLYIKKCTWCAWNGCHHSLFPTSQTQNPDSINRRGLGSYLCKKFENFLKTSCNSHFQSSKHHFKNWWLWNFNYTH